MMNEDDEMRRLVRELFHTDEPRPTTRAPRTADDYRRWNESCGWKTSPPELVEDVDGLPIGVTTSDTPLHATVCVTVADLAEVGLTPDDVPNLTIIPSPKESKHS